MSPSTGHPIPAPPAPPKPMRKRKSPPQPRSGVISARQPVAAETSRPAPAPPAPPAPPKPMRKRTNVADLVKRIQDMEDALAQVVCDHEARLDALEIKMAGLIQRVHASTDSVTLDDMAGVCRRLDALEAAGEVTRVMAQPHPVLVQAKAVPAPAPHKSKEQTMSQSTKETAVPSAVKSYANHLIWAAVIIASLLIWAVASNRGGLEPKYTTAQVNASGMLMGQVEDGTWAIIGQIDRDSVRRAEWQAGFRRGHGSGEAYGYDSAVKRIHDSLSRIPKPRKATMADFETDAERARRLDSAARMGKRGPL